MNDLQHFGSLYTIGILSSIIKSVEFTHHYTLPTTQILNFDKTGINSRENHIEKHFPDDFYVENLTSCVLR